ncbi:MAG: nitrate ABC transporter permease, partial [Thermoanaerobaculia bacterium]
MRDITSAFAPNRTISPTTLKIIIAFQVAVVLLIWFNSPYEVLPKPGEVGRAFSDLWLNYGLGRELWTSFTLNLQALALT